jgi:hypothetical protein
MAPRARAVASSGLTPPLGSRYAQKKDRERKRMNISNLQKLALWFGAPLAFWTISIMCVIHTIDP